MCNESVPGTHGHHVSLGHKGFGKANIGQLGNASPCKQDVAAFDVKMNDLWEHHQSCEIQVIAVRPASRAAWIGCQNAGSHHIAVVILDRHTGTTSFHPHDLRH